ncbi:hypothetical protein AVEN_64977-1 [Araneus ventricosus]|uniref:Uncharacterized protein n=1 Tax=Araneus ventricosus TaxID=182803 RepID=A0A4Y2EM13_ARAVE|nr:hypothetical protein AVEN_41384-1 [Araneus ventricosus]GBM29589.1 hypothetical protein AVEN_64977-1 [Araneus ventricosus]
MKDWWYLRINATEAEVALMRQDWQHIKPAKSGVLTSQQVQIWWLPTDLAVFKCRQSWRFSATSASVALIRKYRIGKQKLERRTEHSEQRTLSDRSDSRATPE